MTTRSIEPPSGTVAMLFTDIEGSTRLAQELGDRWESLLDRHRAILRQAFARHEGYEVKTEGDGFFIAFARPHQALTAAVEAQRALAAEPWGERPVRVRMGLHVGEAELRDGDYLGVEVHRAARIAAAGRGGQLLVSSATAAMLGDRLPDGTALRDLGEFSLKDFDAPQRLYLVQSEGLDNEPGRIAAAGARRGNLPERRSTFIGRERELEAVMRTLEQTSLLTLTGPGGTGKTTIALEAARGTLDRYPDGAWLVELAPLRDAGFMAGVINSALGLGEDPARAAGELLTGFLADRRLLLLLDNLEQLMPNAAPLVDDLLGAAPGLTVLATSREPLHVGGEQEYPVPPLDIPQGSGADAPGSPSEAAQLFSDRARAVFPSFALTDDNLPAVEGIVRRLDGLPLAIELAAARAKLLSPAEILERLSRGSSELRHPDALRPERQRTLRDAIGWSHQLLGPEEQAFFAGLSVFSGGFTPDSAEAVCRPAGDALDLIASMVDKSLVRRVEGQAGTRFTMLETIREFAAERLAESDPDGDTRQRHARHVLAVAEEARPRLTLEAPEPRERLTDELDNIRAAFEWAVEHDDAETGFRLLYAVWRLWHIRALLAEGRQWAERVLALPTATERGAARARGLLAAGNIYYWMRAIGDAERCYRAGLAEAEALGDRALEAEALVDLLFLLSVFTGPGESDEADDLEARIRALGTELDDEQLFAFADFARAGRAMANGQLDEARHRASDTRRIVEASGDMFFIASAYNIEAALDHISGNFDQAIASAVRSAEIFAQMGDRTAFPLVIRSLASSVAMGGRPEVGARLAGFAAQLEADSGNIHFTPPYEPPDAREVARTAIGPEAATQAFDSGRRLSQQDAMELIRTLV
jgi:predicted ATPase/class 3 adenylate cyclase